MLTQIRRSILFLQGYPGGYPTQQQPGGYQQPGGAYPGYNPPTQGGYPGQPAPGGGYPGQQPPQQFGGYAPAPVSIVKRALGDECNCFLKKKSI